MSIMSPRRAAHARLAPGNCLVPRKCEFCLANRDRERAKPGCFPCGWLIRRGDAMCNPEHRLAAARGGRVIRAKGMILKRRASLMIPFFLDRR
jgi:hypothetical protein